MPPSSGTPGKPSRWGQLARSGHQGAQFKDVQPKYPIKVSELLGGFYHHQSAADKERRFVGATRVHGHVHGLTPTYCGPTLRFTD
jgi:hypothetical protein